MTISNRMTLRRPCLCGQCLIGWAIRITSALAGAFAGLMLLGLIGGQVHLGGASGPRMCTFDGGGTITAGQAARTSDGHVWQCTEDGRLVRIG